MNPAAFAFVLFVFLFRLATLTISIRHERGLRKDGAIEYGALNSKILTVAYTSYLIAAAIEGAIRNAPFDIISAIGFILYGISFIAILAVIRLLGRFWTVKLLIARDHSLVLHPFLRLIRHPNYFLNAIPELVGVALVLHAYDTLVVGLPVVLILFANRIRQEERAMKATFAAY
ncbi:isoprenylcysteine carboxylmethyltransferase family protein [Tunturibacter empetritectus]|uniref:Isoprenylcysteine carboxyl methyltransferase (ICMT) family protein YpbQ n=1 Tax=Tunturiibacter lichenicola TaxID=2051959 RepID=A0A7W8JAD0_9BACT|nr:isoprenylcysteine carboxylmethyltransferase family protein [Edaphobacter lichenicola]MBB5345328.1 isoprenylcysteine carboxyl methyltransferase (ICMT) family protein YpbQ [Edaphobacter lichenicola]